MSDVRDIVHRLMAAKLEWRDWMLLSWKRKWGKERDFVMPTVVRNEGHYPTLVFIVIYLGCQSMKSQVEHVYANDVYCLSSI